MIKWQVFYLNMIKWLKLGLWIYIAKQPHHVTYLAEADEPSETHTVSVKFYKFTWLSFYLTCIYLHVDIRLYKIFYGNLYALRVHSYANEYACWIRLVFNIFCPDRFMFEKETRDLYRFFRRNLLYIPLNPFYYRISFIW